jgi:hypothetical protein
MSRGRGRGDINLEVEEGFLLEEDTVAILQILEVEVKIKIPINQVVRDLIYQRFSAIIVKCMDTIHMNEGRDNIIITSKVNINQTMQILPPTYVYGVC